uniref:non-specific serine/threonine protein kinase n=1 Tax=Daucus carota subsp. sativus TaxID=79200 RepID=A0A175YFP7_DAUCS
MWRFKPFTHKEQAGLEGRIVDIGNLKVHVRNVIAEGGFSCVYLARDAINGSKQYAIKHIICNDEESLELVMKEISVMKSLKGHPNVVTLCAHTIMDMGRTKEALLVMEYCEKSLVNVLESRGAGYYEEKQILAIFRDVCNAVFAMHCQSPPIAHRDLKAENLLLGSDGLWKLCDFGSISTNHKRFERAEEMGIEEDNIRKHTTPAYRAPEMWDLFRKDLINEKVDIWVWFRVNGLLPDGLQKSLPDKPPEMKQHGMNTNQENLSTTVHKGSPMPRRSPPPPPTTETHQKAGAGGPMGAFWTTQHGKDSVVTDDKIKPKYDESASNISFGHDKGHPERPVQKGSYNKPTSGPSNDFEINFFPENSGHTSEKSTSLKSDNPPAFQGDAFNAFVAEFDNTKVGPISDSKKSGKEELLEAEIERLKEQLKQANVEKAEVTSKYEKLTAICRSQRQELQELKQALASKTPNTHASKNQTSPGIQKSSTPPQREKVEGTVWELQQGLFDKNSVSPDTNSWKPFVSDPIPLTASTDSTPKSVRTKNGQQNKQDAEVSSGAKTWGFGTEGFTAVPAASSSISGTPKELNSSKRFGDSKAGTKSTTQPAGWAGF